MSETFNFNLADFYPKTSVSTMPPNSFFCISGILRGFCLLLSLPPWPEDLEIRRKRSKLQIIYLKVWYTGLQCLKARHSQSMIYWPARPTIVPEVHNVNVLRVAVDKFRKLYVLDSGSKYIFYLNVFWLLIIGLLLFKAVSVFLFQFFFF
jgi:hypothetical protein